MMKEYAALNEAMLSEHLERAHRHVADGKRVVERQRKLVHRLERSGRDSRRAHWLLGNFEDLLQIQVQGRNWLIRELARGLK